MKHYRTHLQTELPLPDRLHINQQPKHDTSSWLLLTLAQPTICCEPLLIYTRLRKEQLFLIRFVYKSSAEFGMAGFDKHVFWKVGTRPAVCYFFIDLSENLLFLKFIINSELHHFMTFLENIMSCMKILVTF